MLSTRLTSRKTLAALLAASSLVAGVLPAASASASSPKPIKKTARGGHPVTGDCVTLGNTLMGKLSEDQAEKAVLCLINNARQANGVPPLMRSPGLIYLARSAKAHAHNGVATRSWVDWQHSHMEPGAAGDYSTQVTNRILATGYCRNGSYLTREVTYTQGAAATPADAVNFWMTDPPHREVLLMPDLKMAGTAAIQGLSDPGQQLGSDSGTFVVDFGSCNDGPA